MAFDPKGEYQVVRTDKVGIGDFTRQFTAGEVVTTKDVPADVLEVLWRNEQVVEYEGPDLEALKYQPVQYVDPATGAIERNLQGTDPPDPESQARLAGTPGNAHIDPPDEKQVFKDSEDGSLHGMLESEKKEKK